MGGKRRAAALVVGVLVTSVLAVPSGEAGAQQPSGDTSTTSTTAAPTATTTEGQAPSPPVTVPLPPATPGPPPPVDPHPPPLVQRPPQAAARAADAGLRRAKQELATAEKELKGEVAHELEITRRLRGLEAEAAAAEGRLAALSEEEKSKAEVLISARGRLRNLAVGQYVTGGNVGLSLQYLVNADGPEDLARRGALLSHASEVQGLATNTYKRASQAASEEVRAGVRSREEAVSRRDLAVVELQAASERVRALGAEVDNRRLLLDLATAAAPVPPSDVPRLFLDAYQRAASTMQSERPRCRVGWTAIAAIGKIESDHGRFRGARTTLNGDPIPPIVGIRLDGSNSGVVADTEDGLLDGDLEFDRAVGPMQFIPSSWSRVARDANGDGNTDVHNAYDAALGTATYLCRAVPGGGLDLDEGLRPAFFSYNHSSAYVESVLGWHRTYASMAASMPSPSRADRSLRAERGRR